MHTRGATPTETLLCRLETDQPWRGSIEAYAADRGIAAAWFTGMGAVQEATLAFYDQEAETYERFSVDEHLEVASCVGNIAMLDGAPFAHTHMVLSRPDGTTVAGHLDEATVFAGELHMQVYETPLERQHHAPTGLDLWLNA
ncbi:MAG: DNA-binding protein [Haloquadratum sp.]|jgi:predicted DNA-binding protein with PD1-like motif|nr:DNA-binding protein [Haloferacaceae archaeon]MDR9445631.1 DNA-binding protein [Haloquadratum sp.]